MPPSAPDEPRAVLPFAGREVTRVEFDQAVGLLLDDGSCLRVEAPLTLVRAAGTDVVVPGEVSTLAPALPLFGRTVSTAVVHARTLELAFDDGTLLRVVQGPSFEAWTATGPGRDRRERDGWMMVSTGSGRLAVWRAEPAGGRFPADPGQAPAALLSLAACFAACLTARTSASDAGPVMSATDRRDPSSP